MHVFKNEAATNFPSLLQAEIERQDPGVVTIMLGDTRQYRVWSDVTFGLDYMSFRPNDHQHKLITVLISQIVSFQ